MIQAKLSIGKPDDKYEREAEHVADKVMRMPEPVGSGSYTKVLVFWLVVINVPLI